MTNLSELSSLANPNPKPRLCDSDRQVMMAIKLGLNPNARDTWPLNTINNLIILEDTKGKRELINQIRELNGYN